MNGNSHIMLGRSAPDIVNVLVEIPKGSSNKYEYDQEMGVIKLDRVLHSPVFYPGDYGFIPQTLGEDGDPLDIVIITDSPTFPGCLVEARPLATLEMSDEKGNDEKIIAVPTRNPHFNRVQKLEDLEPHILKAVKHFFDQYKILEEKEVIVKGYLGIEETHKLILDAHQRFTQQKNA